MSLDAHYVIVRRIGSNLLDRDVKLSKPVYINKNALPNVTGEKKNRELLLIMFEQIQQRLDEIEQRLDEIEEKLDKKQDKPVTKVGSIYPDAVSVYPGTVSFADVATMGPHPGLSTSPT